MLDKITETAGKIKKSIGENIDYVNPFKFVPALGKAWEAYKKAKETGDKGWLEKLGIFWSAFKKEMKGVEKEKAEVSEKTKEKVGQDVNKTLKDVEEAVALSDKVTGENKKAHKAGLAAAVTSFKRLDEKHQTYAYQGWGKVEKASEGEKAEVLDADELSSLAAVGMLTLVKLKAEYPDKAKFAEMLKRFKEASDKSKYPLSKLLNNSVLKIFKIADMGEGLKLLERLNIPTLKALDMKDALTTLGTNNFSGANKDKVAKFMKEHIFKKTTNANVENALTLISGMIRKGGREISVDQLTDLVFCINSQDLTNLVDLLVGKRRSEYGAAAA